MSFSYMNTLFTYNFQNTYNIINNLIECKIFCVNDDLSCLANLNNKLYKIYLKNVPKEKNLKQYLKYLVMDKYIKVELLNSKKNKHNTYNGILYDINNNNINKLLIQHSRYYIKKYIYDKNNCRKTKKNFKYKSELEIIYEEDENNVNIHNNT